METGNWRPETGTGAKFRVLISRFLTILLLAAVVLGNPLSVRAQAKAGKPEGGGWGVATGTYLYTEPDPSASGGIRGRIAVPGKPLLAALAIPPDEPGRCYRAALTGDGNRGFSFSGLPVSRYDLLFVFEDAFYDGLALQRGEDTLTDEDRDSIRAIITKSEPFYPEKLVRRVKGETGSMTGKARAVCTFLRAKASVDYTWGGGTGAGYHEEHRRSIKLVLLEDVGPAWQVVRTRELYTLMLKPGSGPGDYAHRPWLGGIRVTDAVRDIGEIDLSASER